MVDSYLSITEISEYAKGMPEHMLRDRLPIGPPYLFAEKLTAFAKAGVQRVFIWPVANELHQLERFWNDVRPLVAAALGPSVPGQAGRSR